MPISTEARVLPAPSRADRNVQNASKAHCTAFVVLGDGAGTRMQAESKLELDHIRAQVDRPDVADVREQVLFRFGHRDELTHVFDIVVTMTYGARTAYTVKPEVRLVSGRFLDEMQTIAWWVRKKGLADMTRLLTEADLDPVAGHNESINAALRDVDAEAEDAARNMVRTLRGVASIRDLTGRLGLEARGYRALLRLIRHGELGPVGPERITPSTLVEWKGSTQ
jgi:hypothetical protein